MTTQQKHQAVSLFLKSFDLSSSKESTEQGFSYQAGSNEGGYMNIGGFEYRCTSSTEIDYRNAVAFYLTLN